MTLSRWTAGDLDHAVSSGSSVLVDLRADWCPQCGPQEGVIARVAPDFDDVVVGSVDVGEQPQIADRFGVKTLPTLLLFRAGVLHAALTGFTAAGVVRRALTDLVGDRAP